MAIDNNPADEAGKDAPQYNLHHWQNVVNAGAGAPVVAGRWLGRFGEAVNVPISQ